MTVFGTAGHVDHGKSSLVKALTGCLTDRLPEEQRREITIELGFSALELSLSDGSVRRVSIIDMPGHERFVSTMVKGANGIDVALFVVSADAGVMPQSREHLAILSALRIAQVIGVLTRCDLVDDEMGELAALELRSLLDDAAYKDAPIVHVSAKTGLGLAGLRKRMAEAVERTVRTERKSEAITLFFDRVFVPKGLGVVVTGTLKSGVVREGDALEVFPDRLRVRVKSLHHHGQSVSTCEATARVAAQLSGASLDQLHRGQALLSPDSAEPVFFLDGLLFLSSRECKVRAKQEFQVFLGTHETTARIVRCEFANSPKNSQPEAMEPVACRLRFREAQVAFVGDRLVLRGAGETQKTGHFFGHFLVIRVNPERRWLVGQRDNFLKLEHATDEERSLFELTAAAARGISELSLRTKLPSRRISSALRAQLMPFEVCLSQDRRWFARQEQERIRSLAIEILTVFHREHPTDVGMPRAQLLSKISLNGSIFLAEYVVLLLEKKGDFVCAGELILLKGFTPSLDENGAESIQLLSELKRGAYGPPTLSEYAALHGVDIKRVRALAKLLAKYRKVAQIQGDLWLETSVLESLREQLSHFFSTHESMSAQDLKDMLQVSRKFLVPILEWLDSRRMTLRIGDVRKPRDLRGDFW